MSKPSRKYNPQPVAAKRLPSAKLIQQLNELASAYRCALNQGDYKLGCKLAERALAFVPGNLMVLSDYALCLMRTERYEESYKAYKAIYEAPEAQQKQAANTWLDGLAEVCGHLGKTEDVRRYGLMSLERAAERYEKNGHWALAPEPPVFDASGLKQNVIAYSLFGSNPKYCEGAIMNARIIPEMLPGWACRVYLDSSVPQHVHQRLRASGAQLVNMDNELGRALAPTMWRFLVMDDPQVQRYLLRDADSLLCEKETAAVVQWVKSPYWFHHMRDYFTHTDLILAGMWGGCNGGGLPLIEPLMRSYVAGYNGTVRFTDQSFLREILWPTVRQSLLSHDEIFGFNGALPYPPHKAIRWSATSFHIGSNVSYSFITGKANPDTQTTQVVRFISSRELFEYEAPVASGEWSLNTPFFIVDAITSGDVVIELQ